MKINLLTLSRLVQIPVIALVSSMGIYNFTTVGGTGFYCFLPAAIGLSQLFFSFAGFTTGVLITGLMALVLSVAVPSRDFYESMHGSVVDCRPAETAFIGAQSLYNQALIEQNRAISRDRAKVALAAKEPVNITYTELSRAREALATCQTENNRRDKFASALKALFLLFADLTGLLFSLHASRLPLHGRRRFVRVF